MDPWLRFWIGVGSLVAFGGLWVLGLKLWLAWCQRRAGKPFSPSNNSQSPSCYGQRKGRS